MTLVRVKSYLMKQERLNNLMIHKEHTDELDLKQVANDFVSNSEHMTDAAFLDHLLLEAFSCNRAQNGLVWLGGCGFGLTTLKELAPGLFSGVICLL